MTIKVHELAKELDVNSKELIEKINSMGIEVKNHMSSLSDIDAVAVRNVVLHSKKGAETKIVKVAPKKTNKDESGDKPRVTVKAATIKPVAPVVKAVKAKLKPENRNNMPKPPIGKPVVSKEVEKRSKMPIGKPIPKGEPLQKGEAMHKKEADTDNVPKVNAASATEEVTKPSEPIATAKKSAEKTVGAQNKKQKENPIKKPVKEEEEKRETKGKEKKSESAMKATQTTHEKHSSSKQGNKKDGESQKNKKKTENKQVSGEGKSGDNRSKDRKDDNKNRQKRDNKNESKDKRKQKNATGERPAAAKGRSGRGDKQKKDRERFSKQDKNQKKHPVRSLEKKVRKKHQNKPKPAPEPEVEIEELPVGTKVINVPITVAGFSEQIQVSVSKIIMTLMKLGIMANVNQNIDEDTVLILSEELGINVVIGQVEEEAIEEGLETFEDKEEDLEPRPPIITVMGHVDHGKTSLLDAIRKTNVTASESGGITQHIGASEVEIKGQRIVFLDTPGHEAFTAMRARGAHTTDIAVLVVAADDSVKPQTVESISHAKAAGVPIIVAINKMDKPGANPDIVKKDLSEHGILVEDWGGDVICVPVSAKTGDGIVNLLEMILLQAEVLELKANVNRLAMGTVIEARLDKAKGPVATLLVLNGTLKATMSIVAGTCSGRIRLMSNSKGEEIKKAGPSTAVEVLGLTDVPHAGDEFNAVKDDKLAREIAEHRQEKQREEVMARKSSTTLEELFSSMEAGEAKELNLIVKGDVQGSVGAVTTSLEKLTNSSVKVNIIHTGVGAVTESDVMLAETADAIIIGFNVRPANAVSSIAEKSKVQIRTYRVIYDIIDDVENAMKGMLEPEFREKILGEVEIRETFKVPGAGIIGGAYVTNGKVMRNASIRLVRDGIVIHEGKVSSLKRFKDDAKEVSQGFECGIGIEDYNDIKEGDIIECFQMEEVEPEMKG